MKPIPILMYHSISTEASAGFRKFTLTPELFAAHMEYLKTQGYTVLSVSQLQALRTEPSPRAWPVRPVVLTFDDGFADFYTAALPVLQTYAFPASLFIATSYLESSSRWLQSIQEGERAMLSKAQLREIFAAGIDCGSHTHTHVHLDTVNEKRGREELTRSKETLEQILGQPVTTFAYPYGHYHKQARQWVVDAGFKAACAVKHAISHTDDDLFSLARVTITNRTDVAALASLLAGTGLRLASPKEKLVTTGWRQFRRFVQTFAPVD